MGTTIKIHLFYSEHIWKNDGFNGNCTIFDGKSVTQIYDVTEPNSKNYCLKASMFKGYFTCINWKNGCSYGKVENILSKQ